MNVVRGTRPHQFMAYDGKTLWRIDQNGKARSSERSFDGPDLWRRTGLPSLIWSHSSQLMGGPDRLFSQAKVEEIRGDKVITFTRFVRTSDQPPRVRPFEVTRMDFKATLWVE